MTKTLSVVLFCLCCIPTTAWAQLRAHLQTTYLTNICDVNDGDATGEPELYYRMGIFDYTTDSSVQSGMFDTCTTNCTGDNNPGSLDGSVVDHYCDSMHAGCGDWDIADHEISKVIPPSSGAYFYFSLFDNDDREASDTLGDHWFSAMGSETATGVWNNNASPYYPENPITTACGRAVEGIGWPNNYQLDYSVWFSDSSAPSVPTARHEDDGIESTPYDNDDSILLSWTASTDLDSGVSGYRFTLLENGEARFSDEWTEENNATFCATCAFSLEPVHDAAYEFSVRSVNGEFPLAEPLESAEARVVRFTSDLLSPVSSVVSPEAGSWHNTDLTVEFSDSDLGVGLVSDSPRWRIISSESVVRDWEGRGVSGTHTVTVGPEGDCHDEGADACRVEALSDDLARLTSAVGTRSFGIDWSGDEIVDIAAWTEPGGIALPPLSPQHDADPYLTWSVPGLQAPIAGYALRLFGTPPCAVEFETDNYAFPDGMLADGAHRINIRAIDEAGNCGPVATFRIIVESGGPVLDFSSILPERAAGGTELTIILTSDRDLEEVPTVIVDDRFEASWFETTERTYTYFYTVDGSEPEGRVGLVAIGEDSSGKEGSVLGWVNLDYTRPLVVGEVNVEPALATADDLLTIQFEVDEELEGNPIVNVATGEAVFSARTDNSYEFVYTVLGTEVEGPIDVRVSFTDVAGNPGTGVGSCSLDFTSPSVDIFTPSGVTEVTLGTELEITWTTEEINPGSVSIDISTDGGESYAISPAVEIEDIGEFTWIVEGPATDQGRIRVTVVDEVGLSGWDEAEFIRVDPPAADHLVANVEDGVAYVAETELVTIVAVERDGTPIDSDVVISVTVSGTGIFTDSSLGDVAGLDSAEVSGSLPFDGVATITVGSSEAGEVEVLASSVRLPNEQPDEPTTITFTMGDFVDQTLSTIEAVPTRVLADGVAHSDITVTPRNSAGDLMGGDLDVEIETSYGDLDSVIEVGDGSYVTAVHSEECRTTPATISARVGEIELDETVDVTFTCIEVGSAILTADPLEIPADGDSASLLSLELFDEEGFPLIRGQSVIFHVTSGELGETEAEGAIYQNSLTSDDCGESPIAVTVDVNGVSLTEADQPVGVDVSVYCLGVDSQYSTLVVAPGVVQADGSSAARITVTPFGYDAEPMGTGIGVEVSSTLGEPTTVTDDGDGSYTALLVSEETGEAIITAEVAGVTLDTSGRVLFVGGDELTGLVSLEASLTDGEVAPGAEVTVTVEVTNQSGYELTGVNIELSAGAGAEVVEGLAVWLGVSVSAVGDSSDGVWILNLGELAVASDPISLLEIPLVLPTPPAGGFSLIFQALMDDQPISESTVLSLPWGDGTTPQDEEGCACMTARQDKGLSAVVALLILGLIFKRRVRRDW